MKKDQLLIIPFVGLKEGLHQFDYKIDASFFEQFEYSIVKEGNFEIHIDFYKRINMMELKFKIQGEIHSLCDRCNSTLTVPVSSEEELVVKFGDQYEEMTDEIIVISPNDHELDLSKIVYEYINLLKPIKAEHVDIADCDQSVIKRMEQLNSENERKEHDPRWSVLSKLRKEK